MDGKVVDPGCAREKDGSFRWERVGLRRRFVVDDPPGDHRTKPFTDVALLQSRALGDVGARRLRALGHRVEQASPVADADCEAEHPVVQDADETL